jgi:D-sedoheptulose 7-phosphate isomerase
MNIFQSAIAGAQQTLQAVAALQSVTEKAARLVGDSLTSGGKLLVCGNGGSAADGADFATEFACRFLNDRRPFPAINLTGCGTLLTAIGNDYSGEQIFARQVRAFGKADDILVAISTSGKSANIIAALAVAAELGLQTIALLGRDGGQAKGLATIELIVPGTATARIQEAHKFLLHVICEMTEERLRAA